MPKKKKEKLSDWEITLKKNIKKIRTERKLTQPEFAKMIGVNKAQTISDYEKLDNKYNSNTYRDDQLPQVPPMEVVVKISEVFNIPIDVLLGKQQVNNKRNIKTYKDLLECLIDFVNGVDNSIEPCYLTDLSNELLPSIIKVDGFIENMEENEFGLPSSIKVPAFFINNNIVASFIESWEQIYKLKENKQLDQKIYNQIIEGMLANYSNKYISPFDED